jgi:hypothetical protein
MNAMLMAYYMNNGTSEKEFRKLNENERRHLLGELVLQEYSALAYDMATALGKEFVKRLEQDYDNSPKIASKISSDRWAFANVTKGDITKFPNYKQVKELVNYSLMMNSHIQEPNEGNILFTDQMTELQTLLKHIEDHTDLFAKVIAYERENTSDEGSIEENKFGSSFFYVICTSTIDNISVLYNRSIKASIDFNVTPPKVKTLTFEYDGGNDEAAAMVQSVNNAFKKGNIRTILKSLATKEGRKDLLGSGLLDKGNKNLVNEANYYAGKLMHENIGDVAFAFISNNKFFDLLLLPIYILRYFIYLSKYTFKTYNQIADNIENSLRVTKNTNLSAAEFQDYKNTVSHDVHIKDQGDAFAFGRLDTKVQDDKALMNDIAKKNDTGGLVI